MEAVRRVEAGEIQRVLAAELGVARITLIEWLRHHRTAAYARVKRRMFTPAQKHVVAREPRAGRLSEDEALLKYGIGEKKTLRGWGPPSRLPKPLPRPPTRRLPPRPPGPTWPPSCGRRLQNRHPKTGCIVAGCGGSGHG